MQTSSSNYPASPAVGASSSGPRNAADLGLLLLRLSVGGMLLLHGVAKIVSGPATVVQLLQAHGLPGALAWAVYVGEVLAPMLLVIGQWTRAAAVVIVVNMVVAVALAHLGDIGRFNDNGGWAIELQAMYLAGAAALALLGAGRLSLGGIHGQWN